VVAFEVLEGDEDSTSSGLSFQFTASIAATDVRPSHGPVSGGTPFSVHPHSTPQPLTPEPETLHPEPSTPDPSLNSKPKTLKQVIGSNFYSSTDGLQCALGGEVVAGLYVSSSVVRCVSTPGAKGAVTLQVSNNGGADYYGADLRFLYVPPLAVASLSVSNGPESGGNTLEVHRRTPCHSVEYVLFL
jgi:hypothetical protein